VTHVESDALVLRHVRQGDTSHVVTLLVRDGGKVAVLAKGSRQPGSRFGAGLDLFTLSHVRYRPRPSSDLVFLDACEIRRSFADLAKDVLAYAAAGVCAELAERLLPEHASSDEIFDLLRDAFATLVETAPLPAGEEMRAVALPVVFQMKLMDALGIAPQLAECVACGATDLAGSTSISPRRGGLVCAKCRVVEGGRRLGSDTVAFLRESLFGELGAVMTSIAPPSRATTLEARGALDALLEYHHHGRPGALRSRKFLDELWR
jgi:DNA repair protein RecO (recombination protein O)